MRFFRGSAVQTRVYSLRQWVKFVRRNKQASNKPCDAASSHFATRKNYEYCLSMLEFRNAIATDAVHCFEIEAASYQGDEAATLEKISKRIELYPDGFLILEIDGAVVGFINSGCAHDVKMSDEEFKELVGHDPHAPNVVIMSVVVDPTQQGKGLSRALMEEFVLRMKRMNKVTVHLMCNEHHVPLYEKFGYSYLRPSASEHAGMAWHEMSMTL